MDLLHVCYHYHHKFLHNSSVHYVLWPFFFFAVFNQKVICLISGLRSQTQSKPDHTNHVGCAGSLSALYTHTHTHTQLGLVIIFSVADSHSVIRIVLYFCRSSEFMQYSVEESHTPSRSWSIASTMRTVWYFSSYPPHTHTLSDYWLTHTSLQVEHITVCLPEIATYDSDFRAFKSNMKKMYSL